MHPPRHRCEAVAICALALIAAACGDRARSAPPSAAGVWGADAADVETAGMTARAADHGDATANLRLAQIIRRAIVADETLTTPPRRIKVIADDRAVTLRGSVDSDQERRRIAEMARRIAGGGAVTDELSVVRAAGEPVADEPPA